MQLALLPMLLLAEAVLHLGWRAQGCQHALLLANFALRWPARLQHFAAIRFVYTQSCHHALPTGQIPEVVCFAGQHFAALLCPLEAAHAMLTMASGAGSEGPAPPVSGMANTAGTALDLAQGQIEVASSFAAEAASDQVILSAHSLARLIILLRRRSSGNY